MPHLRKQFLQGIRWTILGTVASTIFQILIVAIIGRILTPEDYGLMALAFLCLRFLAYFSGMGLGASLIQRERIQEEDICTCFWLSTGLGFLFSGLAFVSAPLADAYFHKPQVVTIIRGLAPSFFLSGISGVPIALLRREMRFKVITGIETASYLLGNGFTAIICAVMGLGVWSLVIGGLVNQALLAVSSFAALGMRMRLAMRSEAFSIHLLFGTRYSINTFLDFIFASSEIFLLGRFFPQRAAGLYNRAMAITGIPVEKLSTTITRVTYPAFSRVQQDPSRIRVSFQGMFFSLALSSSALCGGIFSGAGEIIRVLLGPHWEGAILPMRFLAIAVTINLLISVQGVLLDSQGHLKEVTMLRCVGIAMKVIVLGIGVTSGLNGFFLAIPVSLVVPLLLHIEVVRRILDIGWSWFFRVLLVCAGSFWFTGAMVWLSGGAFHSLGYGDFPSLTAEVAAGGFSLIALLWLLRRFEAFGVAAETETLFSTVKDVISIPWKKQ